MANTKSAKKKTKVIRKKTAINRVRIGKYKGAISEMEELIKSGEKVKALKLSDFTKLLNFANLKTTDVLGDYNLNKFNPEDSDRLIIIAKIITIIEPEITGVNK